MTKLEARDAVSLRRTATGDEDDRVGGGSVPCMPAACRRRLNQRWGER
jgi:hypothetical protein